MNMFLKDDPAYDGITENSSDNEKINAVINSLAIDSPSYIKYEKLFIKAEKEKLFNAKLSETGWVNALPNENSSNPVFRLSHEGHLGIDEYGSYLKYIEALEASHAEQDAERLIIKKREKLSDEKLEYDVKNAKRIFKTYWWSFWFAVIALAISLTLGILKVLEWLKPPH